MSEEQRPTTIQIEGDLRAFTTRVNQGAAQLNVLPLKLRQLDQNAKAYAETVGKIHNQLAGLSGALSLLPVLPSGDLSLLNDQARILDQAVTGLSGAISEYNHLQTSGDWERIEKTLAKWNKVMVRVNDFYGKLDPSPKVDKIRLSLTGNLNRLVWDIESSYEELRDAYAEGLIPLNVLKNLDQEVLQFSDTVRNLQGELSAMENADDFMAERLANVSIAMEHMKHRGLYLKQIIGKELTKLYGDDGEALAPKDMKDARYFARHLVMRAGTMTPHQALRDLRELPQAFRQMRAIFRQATVDFKDSFAMLNGLKSMRNAGLMKAFGRALGAVGIFGVILGALLRVIDKQGKGVNKAILQAFGGKGMAFSLSDIQNIANELSGVGKLHLNPEDVIETTSLVTSTGVGMKKMAQGGKESFKIMVEAVQKLRLGIGEGSADIAGFVSGLVGTYGKTGKEIDEEARNLILAVSLTKMDAKSFFGSFQPLMAAMDGAGDHTKEIEGLILAVGDNATMAGPQVQQFFNDLVGAQRQTQGEIARKVLTTASQIQPKAVLKLFEEESAALAKGGGNDKRNQFLKGQIDLAMASFKQTGRLADLAQAMTFLGPSALMRMHMIIMEGFFGEGSLTEELLERKANDVTAVTLMRVLHLTDTPAFAARYLKGVAALLRSKIKDRAGLEAKIEKLAADRKKQLDETFQKLKAHAHTLVDQAAAEIGKGFLSAFDVVGEWTTQLTRLLSSGFQGTTEAPRDIYTFGGETGGEGPTGATGGSVGALSEEDYKNVSAVDVAKLKQILPRLSDRQLRVLAKVIPGAIEGEKLYGVPAAVTIAQAVLESQLTPIPGTNNIFGIKAGAKRATGKSLHWTTEERNGVMHKEQHYFSNFSSIEDSVLAHSELFTPQYWGGYNRMPAGYRRALEAFKKTRDAGAFADHLAGSYATDSQYGAKLRGIMKDYRVPQIMKLGVSGSSKTTYGPPAPKLLDPRFVVESVASATQPAKRYKIHVLRATQAQYTAFMALLKAKGAKVKDGAGT